MAAESHASERSLGRKLRHMTKELAAYLGAVFAIVFGIVLLWTPPAILAGQAATAGTALAFITGGLSALGVTVAIPAVKESAKRAG